MNEEQHSPNDAVSANPDNTHTDSAASAGSESPEEGQAAMDAAEEAVDGHDDA